MQRKFTGVFASLVLASVACGSPHDPVHAARQDTAKNAKAITHALGEIDTLSAKPGDHDHEAPQYPTLSLSRTRGKVSLDGMLAEWPPLVPAKYRSSDRAKEASVNLIYDNETLYVAAEIRDTTLTRSEAFTTREDYLSLSLQLHAGRPSARSAEGQKRTSFDLALFAGKPGESEGQVKHLNHQVPGSKIVEVAFDGGYRIEASIPWSYLTKNGEPRVGILASATYHDAETGTSSASALGRDDIWAPSEPELAAWERLSPETRDRAKPEGALALDLGGGPELEVAEIVAHELWIVGHAFLDGTRYFSRTMSGHVTLSAHKFSFLTKPTLVVEETRETRGGNVVSRTLIDASAPTPRVILQHAVQFGACSNDLRLESDKVTVTGPSVRCDGPGDLSWVSEANAKSVYRWNGSELSLETQLGATPKRKPSPAQPKIDLKPEKPFEPAPVEDAVALLLRAKNMPSTTRPEFRLSGDLAEGFENETVVVLEGEIIIVGEHFRDGSGFLSVRPGGIGKSKIKGVELRRFEGLPHAFIAVTLVHSLDEMTPPLVVESLAIYALRTNMIERVLWIETKRSQGERLHEASVSFSKQSVSLIAGTSRGWTKASFATGEVATDLIPLPPPWEPAKRVAFALDNGRFRRR